MLTYILLAILVVVLIYRIVGWMHKPEDKFKERYIQNLMRLSLDQLENDIRDTEYSLAISYGDDEESKFRRILDFLNTAYVMKLLDVDEKRALQKHSR